MKRNQLITILLLLVFAFSCNEKPKQEDSLVVKEEKSLTSDTNALVADFKKWWSYHYYTISLTSNFIGVNEQLDTIGKKQFLEELRSGDFIPLKVESNKETYKLFRINFSVDKSIRSTIKTEAALAQKYFKMEGQHFPLFDFTDIKDQHYTTENTKGKTVILKTWYIACSACVKEFPELNELVEKYKDRKDMVFVSLAKDAKPDLEKFLDRKTFEYDVVSSQRKFIETTLRLESYPTHIIVDKNGIIVKVVDKASEMISFLEGMEG